MAKTVDVVLYIAPEEFGDLMGVAESYIDFILLFPEDPNYIYAVRSGSDTTLTIDKFKKSDIAVKVREKYYVTPKKGNPVAVVGAEVKDKPNRLAVFGEIIIDETNQTYSPTA